MIYYVHFKAHHNYAKSLDTIALDCRDINITWYFKTEA